MTLYGHAQPRQGRLGRAAKMFADNCAVCHGEAGQGDREMGAPRLASRTCTSTATTAPSSWRRSIAPRMGVMPNWDTRASTTATIKSVTLYVHSLGGGE